MCILGLASRFLFMWLPVLVFRRYCSFFLGACGPFQTAYGRWTLPSGPTRPMGSLTRPMSAYGDASDVHRVGRPTRAHNSASLHAR